MDYSKLTLGELLSSENMAIRRNATGILKQLQKEFNELPSMPLRELVGDKEANRIERRKQRIWGQEKF